MFFLGNSTEGNSCLIDSDCNPPYEICKQLECAHKNVFPLEGMEFGGIIILSLLLALANAGGIGGGEMIVPIC